MTKKIKQELIAEANFFLIRKADNYKDSKIILPLSDDLADKFNSGETIEVSEQKLNEIGNHRWLISEVK